MRPTITDDTPTTFKLPDGGEVGHLPCRVDHEAGTVTSFWEVESEERDRDLVCELVVWVWWGEPIPLEIKIAGEQRVAVASHRDDEGVWQHHYILTGEPLALVKAGALVEMRVAMIPPPPVAMEIMS